MCWSQQLLLSRPLSAATPSATWWTTTRFTGNAAIWRGRNLTRKPVEYHPADRSLTCLTLSSTPRRSQQVSVNVTTLCWYAWGRHKDPHHLACDLRVERLCSTTGLPTVTERFKECPQLSPYCPEPFAECKGARGQLRQCLALTSSVPSQCIRFFKPCICVIRSTSAASSSKKERPCRSSEAS